MSQLRKIKQKAQKEYKLKIKRQKTIFSFFFIVAVCVSFFMLILCAINNGPTFVTTIVSGSVWLVFDIIFACAIKRKWHILFDECSTGKVHSDFGKAEDERKKDNWQGNCFKFAISVAIFLLHLVVFFVT